MKAGSLLLLACFCQALNGQTRSTIRGTVTIAYTPGEPANAFIPSQTLGAAFDGHPKGDLSRILIPSNIEAMRELGFGPLAYRLRTELGMEVWHWNPRGSWSEPGKQQGYWISSSSYAGDIETSNGYSLPRRGNSHDQANDDGYSMIDDGDTNTFWKSNPYLDARFTNEPDSLHRQWVVVDLGKSFFINAMRIQWGRPFALSYNVDYASDIGGIYFDPMQPGLWHPFSNAVIQNRDDESGTVLLCHTPVKARFVRISMSESSLAANGPSTDVRDRLGFAIKEIGVGLFANEQFRDFVKHAPDNAKQSVIHTSSTDPWHRAIDLDTNYEQAGIDKFFKCGLTGGQAVLMPIALLYDTPDNMAAFLQYIKQQKYPVREIEIGEEPEGQLINPQDYAALYCQWAVAVKKTDSSWQTGGPSFASLSSAPPDSLSFTEQDWTRLFLTYLEEHHRRKDFQFFSSEWYPFDNVCLRTAPQLTANPTMMESALKKLRVNILPKYTPVYITEYGYSSHSGRAEVDIEGALMYADILGQALTLGVKKPFLYGYEPTYLDEYKNCSWGNNMLFAMDSGGKIVYHTAAYYGMRMLLHDWAVPRDSLLEIYPAHVGRGQKATALIASYALHSQANKWSIVLINKDPRRTWSVEVGVSNTRTGAISPLRFPLHFSQYSRLLYHWRPKGAAGHPTRELPPVEKTVLLGQSIDLPPYSLTVIREQ